MDMRDNEPMKPESDRDRAADAPTAESAGSGGMAAALGDFYAKIPLAQGFPYGLQHHGKPLGRSRGGGHGC